MSKLFARFLGSLGVAAPWLLACASDSDGGGGGSGELSGARAQTYSFTCAETSCDSCRDAANDRYDECLRLCSQPFAPSGCFSQCPSIGDSSCSHSCGESERCDEWSAELPLPQRDEALFAACSSFGLTCTSSDKKFLDALCDREARLHQPQFAEEYRCVTDHDCDPERAGHCLTVPEPGTMGTALCLRAAGCGEPCRPGDETVLSDEDFINSFEGKLRPSLIDVAKQCVVEPECGRFVACKKALDYLWWLDYHNYVGDQP